MLLKNLRGEDIRPEGIVFPEGHLQSDRIRMKALSRKHRYRVVENMTSALNALVEPACAMPIFVKRHGKGLPATIVNSIDQRDIKLLRMIT